MEHTRFLIADRVSVSWNSRELEGICVDCHIFEVYNETCQLYGRTIQTKWHYTQKRPYEWDVVSTPSMCLPHNYCNIGKAAENRGF